MKAVQLGDTRMSAEGGWMRPATPVGPCLWSQALALAASAGTQPGTTDSPPCASAACHPAPPQTQDIKRSDTKGNSLLDLSVIKDIKLDVLGEVKRLPTDVWEPLPANVLT